MDLDFSFLFACDEWIRLVHIAGAILAVGAVSATDITLLWLKFKPQHAATIVKISPLLSLQVWIGLALLSVSGLLLFLPMRGLETIPIFQFKMLLVLAVFINGLILNFWITPRFEKLASEWHLKTKAVKKFTNIAGVTAAVSFLGWWGLIVLMYVFY